MYVIPANLYLHCFNMNKTTHKIYISTLVGINVFVFIWLTYKGLSYYQTPIVERFFHVDHANLKPSGPFGHGYGILGTLLIAIGVFSYIARKKYRFLHGLGRLKYWLEFHIFLCSLGPILILFHTAFKFGGIVSVSFWSMIAVVVSGIIGRFIYIQIPRTIEGRELSLNEVKDLKGDLKTSLKEMDSLDESTYVKILDTLKQDNTISNESFFKKWWIKRKQDYQTIRKLKAALKQSHIKKETQQSILSMIKNEISLNHKIERLLTMQTLFKYWHVAHLPFALIMAIILIIHVAITLSFGYRWIF